MAINIYNPFPNSTYETPDDMKRQIGDQVVFKSSLYFYSWIFKIVFDGFLHARKGRFDKNTFVRLSYETLRAAEYCGIPVKITGLDNINKHKGPLVIIGNHMSTYETFALSSMILPRKEICFIVKKSLLTYPAFGVVMKSLSPIAIGRIDPREDFKTIMTEGVKAIESGRSIIVFPQATRNHIFIPEEFNTVGIKLAKHAKVPVVPLALKTDFLGNGRIIKDFGPIDRSKKVFFHFDPPIEITGTGKDQHIFIVSLIQKKLEEWNRL